MKTLGGVVAMVLLVLSGWHIYWAVGGQRGIGVVLPKGHGGQVLQPPVGATWLVALALAVAAAVVLGRVGIWHPPLPDGLFRWGTWTLATVFGLRAVGDFRMIGFFKRVHDTPFARWDDALFSPLCLLLCLCLVLISVRR